MIALPHPDRDSSTPLVTVVLETDAEYHVDQTQSTRFELKEDSDDDVFEAGEEMDEDIQEPNIKETQTHHSIKTPT
ncbi:hypothetical protein Tco_0574158 [Tanacetum coccineum]